MLKRYRNTAVSQYVVLSVLILAVIGSGFFSTLLMEHIEFNDYFVIPWAAGLTWLKEGVNPYDESITQIAEDSIAESGYLAVLPEEKVLTQPIINLFIYLPFSLIPYRISRALWVTLSILLTGFIVYLSLRLSGWKLSFYERAVIIVLNTLWLPGAFSVITGQLTPIVIFLLLLSITLILNGQDTASGFLLALTFGSLFISIVIIFFLLLWSISKKKWAVIKAYFAGLAFILILSWLLLPSWFMDWLNVIIPKLQNTGWIQTPLLTLAVLLPGIENFLKTFLHAGFGVFFLTQLITAFRKSGQKFIWKLFVIFIIAVLFNVQPVIGQILLVIPCTFFVFRFWEERWRIFGRLLSWVVILFLSIGSWLFFIPEVGFVEQGHSLIFLVVFPIIILVAMLWVRWWAYRIPKLESEI